LDGLGEAWDGRLRGWVYVRGGGEGLAVGEDGVGGLFGIEYYGRWVPCYALVYVELCVMGGRCFGFGSFCFFFPVRRFGEEQF